MKTALKLCFPLLAAAAVACNPSPSTAADGGGSSSGGSSAGASTGAGGSTGGGGSTGSATGGGSSGGTGGGLGLGAACTVSTVGGSDPCAPTGYACVASAAGSAAGTCQLPGPDSLCLQAVGCEAGDVCLEVSTSPVQYGCFQTCTSSSDCTVISSSCQADGPQKICNANTCGPGLPTGYPSSGPSFYAPCDAVGTGDGLCLPYDYTGLGTIGLCFAEGPADAGSPTSCSLNRVDGGALCPFGTFCLPDTTTGLSACERLCQNGGPDGGPVCGASAYCLGLQGGPYFGFCLDDCSGAGSCPSNETCQSIAAALDAGTVCAP